MSDIFKKIGNVFKRSEKEKLLDKPFYMNLCRNSRDDVERHMDAAKRKKAKEGYVEGDYYELQAFFHERERVAKGFISDVPTDTVYYWDADGEPCYTNWKHLHRCIERSNDTVVRRHYGNNKLNFIDQLIFKDGKPIRYVHMNVVHGIEWEKIWFIVEDYEYSGNKLFKIIKNDFNNSRAKREVFHIEYDEAGQIRSIREENGESVYEYLSNEAADLLRSEVKEGLINESVNALKRMGIRLGLEKACFVAIYLHDEPEAVVDPTFHAGLQKIRIEQIANGEDISGFWNSGEHPVHNQTGLENMVLQARFRDLIKYWEIHSDWSETAEPTREYALAHKNWFGESKALWQEVAMELNNRDWSEIMPVTDNFVIYQDDEAFEIESQLILSVPNAIYEKLRLESIL